jgi:hypothetical protein
MKKLTVFIVLVCAMFCACKMEKESGDASNHTTQFGERIDTLGMMPYHKLLEQMKSVDSMDVKVIGTVSAVCQAKGCWMNIVSDSDSTGTEMFVEFKNYGFFVPKDLAGKTVVLDGKAFREETSVEELRHYAEDEGKTREEIDKITSPEIKLKFLASGVLVLP